MIAAAAVATAAGGVGAGSFQGLSYSSTVSKGKWTTNFNEASERAESENVPLVVIWVSKSCGYCKNFAANLSSKTSWMKSRGYYFVIGIGESGVNATIKNYARNSSGKYPYCKVFWKKNLDGERVEHAFTGRSGTSAMSGSKFASVVDKDTQAGKYAKTYKLTVTPDTDGCKVSGAGFYKNGSKATLKVKSVAKGHVFAGWYDGKNLLSQKTSCSYAMPPKETTLTAKFIKKENDWAKISYPLASYSFKTKEASYAKSKTMESVSVSASGGSLPSVKFSGLPKGMKYSSGKISGKPSKSGIYTVTGRNKTSGGAVAAQTNTVVVRATGEYVVKVTLDSDSAGMGTLSGSGVFKAGKTVTLKAKPKSGKVFSCWLDEGGALRSRSASYKYKVAEQDVVLKGRFITKAEDREAVSLSVKVDGKRQTLGADPTTTNKVMRGVRLEWPLEWVAISASKLTVSGLPAGLKLTTNASGVKVIAGVPSSASALDSKTGLRKPSLATVKVVTAGNTVSHKLAIVVEPLPVWAYGTFDGLVETADGAVGAATLTVSSKGVVSGKYSLRGTNWTFSVTGFESADRRKPSPLQWSFFLKATAKYGKKAKCPVEVKVEPGPDEDHLNAAYANDEGAGGKWLALRRAVWADTGVVKRFAPGKYPLAGWLDGVTATVASSGKVTYSGMLDGQKISSTATVHEEWDWNSECYYFYSLFILPSTKASPGFSDKVIIPAKD